jgi:hypothetical protein
MNQQHYCIVDKDNEHFYVIDETAQGALVKWLLYNGYIPKDKENIVQHMFTNIYNIENAVWAAGKLAGAYKKDIICFYTVQAFLYDDKKNSIEWH